MRNAEQLGGYYEMPMAIVVRIVMTVMAVVVRVVAMTITVLMVPRMAFADTLFVRRASFDMDVGNVASRVSVPQGGANPRYVSRVQQQ